MQRSVELTPTARWWPSVLYQTATLEVVRDGERLLVDPGIALWEIAEVSGDGAGHILLTHADWDHVMAVGVLADARVHASAGTAERIGSGEAVRSVRKHAAQFYVAVEGLDRLRVDEVVAEGTGAIGPWSAEFRHAPGHSPDGLVTLLPEESLLIVGDHLSELEVPFVEDSARAYAETLRMLDDLIGSTAPAHVVIGHGPPLPPDQARRVAGEDLAYLERLLAYAEGGGDPERPDAVAVPRGPADGTGHADNVRLTCGEVAE